MTKKLELGKSITLAEMEDVLVDNGYTEITRIMFVKDLVIVEYN